MHLSYQHSLCQHIYVQHPNMLNWNVLAFLFRGA